MKRQTLCAVLLGLMCVLAQAEIPAGYYSGLNGKKQSELKTACHNTIRNLTRVSSYRNLPQYFVYTDVYPNSDRWWDMYSDVVLYAPSFSGLNREHSFPKSWWGGLDDVDAYTDLNHLYPSEAAANQAKSNYPLGIVDRSRDIKLDNGVSTVGYPVTGQGGGAKYVFEPADEYKGDFARTYFYMVTCYQDYIWTSKYMYMLEQNDYPTLNAWSLDLLLKWSREDPVSQKEIDRNEVVYRYQNNRNPFIDIPELSEYIWGNKKGEVYDPEGTGTQPDEPVTGPALLAPTQDMVFDLGQVAEGKSVTARLYMHGQELTGDLTLSLYSGDRSMFKLAATTIATATVNSVDGYWLNITYTPTKKGKHTTKLLINGGGISGTTVVNLQGECLDVPVLHICTATEPTDITSDSYTANWTAPADDEIDNFVLTRTIYAGGTVSQTQIVAEEEYVEIDDFGDSDRESYYVQSVRLGYYSDPSNVIFVDHLGITGVEMGSPLALFGIDGAIRFVCSAPHTGVTIYDITGRQIKYIPQIDNNTDIVLPLGIYMVVTDQCLTPMKVIVR